MAFLRLRGKTFFASLLVGTLATVLIAWAGTSKNHQGKYVSVLASTKKHKELALPWYVSPEKKLDRFEVPLEKIVKQSKDKKFLEKTFHSLRRTTRLIKKSTKHGSSKYHGHKNRFKKLFLPFDDTRTCRELYGFYLNANDVHTPTYEYIVAQGPLEHTVADFWKALLYRKVKLIVSLVMAKENGEDKCAGFWTAPKLPLEVDGWTVSLENEQVIAKSKPNPDHRIVVRTFSAKSIYSNKTRRIQQIHYENWPDNGVPELRLFEHLLDVVDKKAMNSPNPIVVHCSAGIGRSGTFVTAHSLRAEIRQALSTYKKDQVRINIPHAIFLLRCQRTYLLANPDQMEFVYRSLAREL